MPQQKAASTLHVTRQSAKYCTSQLVQYYHNNSKKSNNGLTHISELLEKYKSLIPASGGRGKN